MSSARGKIAHFKVPRYVKFVTDFPLTVSGKIQMHKIREEFIKDLGLEDVAKIKAALDGRGLGGKRRAEAPRCRAGGACEASRKECGNRSIDQLLGRIYLFSCSYSRPYP